MADTVPEPPAPDGRPGTEDGETPVRPGDLVDLPHREPFRAPWSDAVSANA